MAKSLPTLVSWPPPHEDALIVNVRSRGKWASFATVKTMVDCLLRPGVVEFAGDAVHWLDAVPKLSLELFEENGVLQTRVGGLLDAEHALRAPFDYGVMTIDYDTKTATAMQDYGRPFLVSLPSWGARTRNSAHVERQWLQKLARTGYLKEAVWEDGSVTPLPMPPSDIRYTALWWERELRALKGMSPPPDTSDPFDTFVAFPLQVPGWTWEQDLDRDSAHEMFQALHPELNAREREAWEDWAQAQEVPQLLKVMRRMDQEKQLEQRLPKTSLGTHVKPRM